MIIHLPEVSYITLHILQTDGHEACVILTGTLRSPLCGQLPQGHSMAPCGIAVLIYRGTMPVS